MNTIGVGIIGGSVGGWAAMSHIPALASLPDYELRAVSTSRRESADLAAKEFHVDAGFDNHADLIAHPGVDLVVVSVKVTQHRELVRDALAAGKMVYSEWPLDTDLAGATDLAARAEAAGVRTAIGLQGRFSPQLRYARDLIADGYVGDVLGTTLVGSVMAFGPQSSRSHAYMFDAANGANTLTVSTMHTLDALHEVLGEFATVNANLVVGRKQVRMTDDGAVLPVTAPDQVAVVGTLESGAALSLFYRGGTSRGDNLHWEINGSDGDLVLTGPSGNVQTVELTLSGARGTDTSVSELRVPDRYYGPTTDALAGPPRNVALLYDQLARDLREGTHTVPDFAHALTRHHLIDSVERAARTTTTGNRT
jgi:predicted dehydrogenase